MLFPFFRVYSNEGRGRLYGLAGGGGFFYTDSSSDDFN